jgi:VCBS repeat-containing protein
VGSPYTYAVTATDPAGGTLTYSLDTAPAGMTIEAATGVIAWMPTAAQAGANAVTVRVTNAQALAATQSFTIQVASLNVAPVAANNAYSTLQGTTLVIAAPGVLANDSDADGDVITAVQLAAPTKGSLSLSANGAFTYVPNAGATGTDTFTYRAFDGVLYSAAATVTITVNANSAPVAVNDSAVAPMRGTGAYTPVVINVVANDTDANGNLNPATVTITVAPNKGGTVSVNANGTVSYTPKRNFRGTETFRYKVRDTVGALSNAATVTVTVQ